MPFIKSEVLPKTGNKIIDAWHHQLAQSVNHAYAVWGRQHTMEELGAILDGFFGNIRRHFVLEESIIRGAGYEDWKTHVLKHRMLRSELEVCVNKLHQSDAPQGALIDAFSQIDSLIYDHEFLEDQDFWTIFERNARVTGGEPLVVWRPNFLLGVPGLDKEHMALVTLLNTIYEMAANDHTGPEITGLVQSLREHTATHFANEEAYGRDHGLPAWGEHADMHAYLLADLDDLAAKAEIETADDLCNYLENYLRYWLIDHIITADDVIRKNAKKLVH